MKAELLYKTGTEILCVRFPLTPENSLKVLLFFTDYSFMRVKLSVINDHCFLELENYNEIMYNWLCQELS